MGVTKKITVDGLPVDDLFGFDMDEGWVETHTPLAGLPVPIPYASTQYVNYQPVLGPLVYRYHGAIGIVNV